MAYPTAVNDQITDSVSQVNTQVLGSGPAVAMGNLYQATGQALSNAAHNATSGQQQTNITAHTATSTGVVNVYALGTATTSEAVGQIYH